MGPNDEEGEELGQGQNNHHQSPYSLIATVNGGISNIPRKYQVVSCSSLIIKIRQITKLIANMWPMNDYSSGLINKRE